MKTPAATLPCADRKKLGRSKLASVEFLAIRDWLTGGPWRWPEGPVLRDAGEERSSSRGTRVGGSPERSETWKQGAQWEEGRFR